MIIYESNNFVPDDITLRVRQRLLDSRNYTDARQCAWFPYDKDNIHKADFIPNDDYYTAVWEEHYEIKTDKDVECVVENYVKPKIFELTGFSDFKRCFLSITRMPSGGHYRLHRDNNHADFGFVWYLNKNWKYDWGGLLITVNKDGTASVKRPIYNNLIILDHRFSNFDNWHFVNRVEHHAKEPRMSILGFLK